MSSAGRNVHAPGNVVFAKLISRRRFAPLPKPCPIHCSMLEEKVEWRRGRCPLALASILASRRMAPPVVLVLG
jgi:hypothetical protein